MGLNIIPLVLFLSHEATLLDFEFDGELLAPDVSTSSARSYIEEQLLYTVGHLNSNNSVGRLDRVTLSSIEVTAQAGSTLVRFHAKLPVAWGSKTAFPTTYVLTLPRAMGPASLQSFAENYKASCTDSGAHDVDSGSMWYYYRPSKPGCTLAEADVVKTTATATLSPENTSGKYPELPKVWEDGTLKVVAIFEKYEGRATTVADAGIAAFNTFVQGIKTELARFSLVTKPATVPTNPGVNMPDITFTAKLGSGRRVTVTALLVDDVVSAGAAFDTRYGALSTRADLIAYNGHAGLGSRVRGLASKGRFVAKQYLIIFMNASDTFAYGDGGLAQRRTGLNGDDPAGTKYLEVVSNGMPTYFSSMPNGTLALFRGLMSVDTPRTYDQIFGGVDRSQVVSVTGEEDNAYYPAGGPGPWTGLDESSTVSKSAEVQYSTPTLAAGRYLFTLTGTGDADLYVRLGSAPTTTVYDCRPYQSGTSEQCAVDLATPERVYVMVRGYATTSTFRIVGEAQ